MELDELGIDIEAQNCLDQIQQESWTSADYDPSQGMTGEELHNFCKFLYSQIQSKDEEISRLTANIKELTDEVRLSRLQQQTYNDENKAVSASHSQKLDVVLQQLQETRQELTDTKRKLKTAETLLADAKEKNRQLEAEREKDAKERKDLENDIALLRSDLYSGTKSQQSGRSAEEVGANDGRDDFDGTDASLPEANRKDEVSSEANSDGEKSEKSQSGEPNNSSEDRDSSKGTPGTPTPKTIYHGPSRKGRTYNKHTVGTPIIHKCDLSHLPEGVTYHIKKNPKKVLHTITKVEEHWFEEVVLTYPDGHKETYFMPQENDKDGYLYDEIVPGTHVTSDFLTEETSNMYDMACPAYREVKNRLSEIGLKTHRQNLANYADKGYEILKLVLPALKDRALAPGSNVNVDETWERFQTHFGHRKTYMWCLVNRKANIVIFFYEDTVDKYGNQKSGGRNRAVLKDFLGDAKLKSLQSDGYICYMYLDDDLIDIEHLCCLAHVRAKLERAERMGCKEASSPMSKIRKLYKREDLYVEKGYDAEKIKEMRNDEYTRGIVDELQNEMFDLMANKMDELPKLMQQALNYLHKFWKQVFAYRNDGEYSIDNLAAERAIRPQTIQRKGSLFFGSVQGALRSAMYNTFIQTCKQVGVSFRQYFKALLKAVKSGRTDYENLLPMTICLD